RGARAETGSVPSRSQRGRGLDDFEVRHYNVGSAPQRRRSELGQFTLKALIVIGLIADASLLSATLLTSRIERLVENTEANAAIHEGRRCSILDEVGERA